MEMEPRSSIRGPGPCSRTTGPDRRFLSLPSSAAVGTLLNPGIHGAYRVSRGRNDHNGLVFGLLLHLVVLHHSLRSRLAPPGGGAIWRHDGDGLGGAVGLHGRAGAGFMGIGIPGAQVRGADRVRSLAAVCADGTADRYCRSDGALGALVGKRAASAGA